MMTGEDRCGPVRAVRVPRVLADWLDQVADAAGGYGKAIELMLVEHELPRDWFRKYPGDPRGRRCDVRLTFRLSERAKRKLQAWAGHRPLSTAIRHLVLYTFTDGRGAAFGALPVDASVPPAPLASARPAPFTPSLARPPAPPPTAARPPAPRTPHPPAQLPGRPTPADAFSHLPPPRPGLSYVCEIRGCEFGAGSGVVVRCRQHVNWVAPAFSHLPPLPTGQRYICQVAACRFTQGDGVSIGATVVPAWCREHAPEVRRTTA